MSSDFTGRQLCSLTGDCWLSPWDLRTVTESLGDRRPQARSCVCGDVRRVRPRLRGLSAPAPPPLASIPAERGSPRPSVHTAFNSAFFTPKKDCGVARGFLSLSLGVLLFTRPTGVTAGRQALGPWRATVCGGDRWPGPSERQDADFHRGTKQRSRATPRDQAQVTEVLRPTLRH